MPTGGLDVVAGSVLGDLAVGAEVGAGIGGLESAVSGQNILKGAGEGALGGALTGGGIGLGGEFLGGTLGATAGEALGGAAGGALGGLATGGNPLLSAAEGGISGGIAGSGILSGAPSGTPAAGTSGASASVAAPASVDSSGATGLPWQDPNYVNPALGAGQTASAIPDIGGANSNVSPSLNSASQTANASPSAQTSSLNTPNLGNGTTGTTNISSQIGQGLGGPPSLDTSGLNISPPSLDSAASAANGAQANPISTALKGIADNPTSLSSYGNLLTASPGADIAALGVGADILKGNQQTGAEKNLVAEAGGLANQGNQLEGYLQSGTLPAGLQASLTQATNAAKATIRSQFAAQGLSGSSAEQQALSQVDMQAQAQSAQMAEQLLTTGINETGMASQLYQDLIKNQMTNDSNLSSAIGNFASAASGGSGLGGNQLEQLLSKKLAS